MSMHSNRTPQPSSVLQSLGEEIVRIVAPVSACMLLVVLLVSVLNSNSPSSFSAPYSRSIATIAYAENPLDSSWDKFKGALLNSLVFVTVITLVTFILLLLFYLRCTKFLKFYMGFSAFVVLAFLGGEIALLVIIRFNSPIDCFTFLIILYNFAAVGVVAVFMSKTAIFFTQSYLVVIGMLVAYWFTLLPEWTTWALLIAMALYDLAAVLLPHGPLRLLVELAISRDEEIPALVYEARPLSSTTSGRVWRPINQNLNLDWNSNNEDVVSNLEEGRRMGSEEDSLPLIDSNLNRREGMGLGSSGAIKLGLGDFIFYSVLVGRAAMYDMISVYACYLAIVAGLGVTLIMLAFYQKALPALPVSVLLGVLFYILTRTLLEVFLVECSLNLVLF